MSENDDASRLAYEAWRQGDYALDCGGMLLGADPEDSEDDGVRIDDSVRGFALVTQTCEIVRATDVVPCITVFPLIEIPAARVRDVERGMSPRYALLHGLPDGVVVDMTRAMSVEKNVLTKWNRQIGCPDEQARRRFALALERTYGRYAFPDAFVEAIRPFRNKVLDKHNKPNGPFGAALQRIDELRVVVHTAWDDAESVPLSFYVIVTAETAASSEAAGKVYEQVANAMDGVSWPAPYHLSDPGIQVTTYADLSARDYLDSYPLEVNDLSGA